MPITLRLTKGTELTYAELDGNFTHINNQISNLPDSGQVSAIILNDVDSAYVQARETPQDFAYASLTGAPIGASGSYNDLTNKPDLGRTQLTVYTVATLPTGGTEGELIYVQDGDAGSPCLAVLDGLGDYKVVSTLGSTVLASGGGF